MRGLPGAADGQRAAAAAAWRALHLPELQPDPGRDLKTLRLYTDGAARGNPGPAGLGVVIEDDQGMRLRGLCRYIGTATNNVAEYLAVIEGLGAVSEWKPDRVEVFLDSKLVVEQLRGNYRVKNAALTPLHARALELLRSLPEVEIRHVERAKN
ncbi:MAG: ribonuclease HI family protein, partial [Chloroflexi bacterium]